MNLLRILDVTQRSSVYNRRKNALRMDRAVRFPYIGYICTCYWFFLRHFIVLAFVSDFKTVCITNTWRYA